MKLGIVGTGMIIRDFLSVTPHLKETELTAICGTKSKESEIEELSEKYNIPNQFIRYDEFLKSTIDTVYLGVPNHLHFQYAKEALESGKNVIVEKPFVSNYKEALILSELVREKQLLLIEAITTLYLPNYNKIKELLPELGNIKIVQCNYSQYSQRYDRFMEGKVLPSFDPKSSGGALMDLNIYNIHFVMGLFGKPENIEYFPNIERGIDTSGILILEYEKFKCVCIGAKDCKAPNAINIQGDKGCIHQSSPANICKDFEILMNDGTGSSVNENNYDHRMINEFLEFEDMIRHNNLEKCWEMLNHSLAVIEVQTIARKRAGIVFQADIEEE